MTDEELAQFLDVSLQTVRLDRMEQSIPEVRRRTQEVAQAAYRRLRSVSGAELLGDLTLLELGRRSISVLHTTPEMLLEKGQVVQGRFIYGQAETLAMALVDAPVALTGMASVKFLHPVRLGEVLTARAEETRRRRNQHFIRVVTRSGAREVFRAKLVVVALGQGGDME